MKKTVCILIGTAMLLTACGTKEYTPVTTAAVESSASEQAAAGRKLTLQDVAQDYIPSRGNRTAPCPHGRRILDAF